MNRFCKSVAKPLRYSPLQTTLRLPNEAKHFIALMFCLYGYRPALTKLYTAPLQVGQAASGTSHPRRFT